MSGFLGRLLARSSGQDPAVRPRVDPWVMTEPATDADWGEVVEEVPSPPLRGSRPGVRVAQGADRDDAAAGPTEPPAAPARPAPARQVAAVRPTPKAEEASLVTPPEPGRSGREDSTTTPRSDASGEREPNAPGESPKSNPRREAAPSTPRREPAAGRLVPPAPAPIQPAAAARSASKPLPVMADRPMPARRSVVGTSATASRAPDVVISIGRIEVRAPAAAPSRPTRVPKESPELQRLERYLETRTGRAVR